MIIYFIFLMLSFVPFFSATIIVADSPWTSFHSKKFSYDMRLHNTLKKTFIFEKTSIIPFTQLICSWNALRPQQGYFSFFAQVHDATTKKWGDWHHMADWGCGVQKTYARESNGISSYAHVRLEVDAKKNADGFRIKIEAHDGAFLNMLHGLFATTSDYDSFVPESADDIIPHMESVMIENLPKIAQFALDHKDNNRICSPVSCAMVVGYMSDSELDPCAFADGVFDEGLSIYGSWACNVAHAFDVSKARVYFFIKRCNSFGDVHYQLMQGLPVIVSVRGTLPGALKPFPSGHLLVIIGWDKERGEVICHDPAAECHDDVLKRYALDDFLRAWERSYRLSYQVEPFSKKFSAKNNNAKH